MNWLGWAKLIGGGVAAPFTGGATLPIAMSGLADVTGGAAKSGQDQNNKADQLKLLLENAKLNRDKFALNAPGTRLSTGMRANLATHATPAKLDWGSKGFVPGAIARGEAQMPTWTGGPSSGLGADMSPDAKQLANTTLHDSLLSQLSGGKGGGNTDAAMPTGIGESSTSDKVLGGTSFATSLIAALLKARANGGGSSSTSPPSTDYSGEW